MSQDSNKLPLSNHILFMILGYFIVIVSGNSCRECHSVRGLTHQHHAKLLVSRLTASNLIYVDELTENTYILNW